ncbi:unnamed protein product [Brassica napus]|uniref:(rape) hypothetical protein n=1 Tax=Brassica napus TaxID=3708 RepID=A0A816ME18_BRANA|nr:unnamed protein product [Brassica napus]
MTKKRDDTEVHKHAEERNGWCSDSNLPPCAAFVEIMAPNAHEKIGVVDAQWIVHQGGSITREPRTTRGRETTMGRGKISHARLYLCFL